MEIQKPVNIESVDVIFMIMIILELMQIWCQGPK